MTIFSYTPIPPAPATPPADAATWNDIYDEFAAGIGDVNALTTDSKVLADAISELHTLLSTELDAEAAVRALSDNALTALINALIIGSGTSSAEVIAARLAGNTDGVTPTTLALRNEWGFAGAWHPMAFGAVGDGATDDRAVLNTLVNTTMSAGGYLIIDRTYRIASTMIFPPAVHLQFVRGGLLDIDTGIIVEIQGSVDAGLYRIFEGDGTVEFDRGSQTVVYPEWFGAGATGSADSAPAINKAIQSLDTARTTQLGGVVELAMGAYRIDTAITIDFPNVTLRGAGKQNTELVATNITTGHAIVITSAAHHTILQEFSANQLTPTGTTSGLLVGDSTVTAVSHVKLLGIKFRNFAGNGITFRRAFTVYCQEVWCVDNDGDGFELNEAFNTSITFDTCYADDNGQDGWDVGSIIYSSWTSCASDNNSGHAYRIGDASTTLPTAGLAFLACGAESNAGAGWFLEADETNKIIAGVALIGCVSFNNNSVNTFGHLVHATRTGTGASISGVTIQNCHDFAPAAGSNSVVANGSGCTLLVENCSLAGAKAVTSSGVIYDRDNRQTYTITNVTTDRAYDANARTDDEIADVLGTLIADLRAQGIVL